MITKEVLQRFVDTHAEEIGKILPGGLKNKEGRWLLVCPFMDRFELDFSKVKSAEVVERNPEKVIVKEEAVEEKPKKAKKSKKK